MPLTEGEASVLESLGRAWDAWCELGRLHPDELAEFRHHLHLLQMMVAWRVCRRDDPGSWGAG